MEDNNLNIIEEVMNTEVDVHDGIEAANAAMAEVTEKGKNAGLVVLGIIAAGAAVGTAYVFIKKKLKKDKKTEEASEEE